jgi:hypothetical protein
VLPAFWGIETPRFVYLEYRTGEAELYDLVADPYELDSLAYQTADQGVRGQLATALAALRAPPPAPGTTIAAGFPPNPQDPSARVFEFFSQVRTTTFRCRLTGPGQRGGWAACDSGVRSYAGLRPGTFTFQVQARDAAGHLDPTPAIRRFTVQG